MAGKDLWGLNHPAPPAAESLDSKVLRQPKLIVLCRGLTISLLSPLPEFPRIIWTGEERGVFLGFVPKNSLLLKLQILGTEGYC